METKYLILDACCGSRMFWFDKHNPLTIFMDNRECEDTLCDGRRLIVQPDILEIFAIYLSMIIHSSSLYLILRILLRSAKNLGLLKSMAD